MTGPFSGAGPGPSPWRKRAPPSSLGAALPPTPLHCVPALGWRPTVGVAPGPEAWGREGRHSQQKASSPDSLTPHALCLLGSFSSGCYSKIPQTWPGQEKVSSGGWKPKIKVPAVLFEGRALFLASTWPPSRCVLTGGGRKGASSLVLY